MALGMGNRQIGCQIAGFMSGGSDPEDKDLHLPLDGLGAFILEEC
jgi:hypothetical protein